MSLKCFSSLAFYKWTDGWWCGLLGVCEEAVVRLLTEVQQLLHRGKVTGRRVHHSRVSCCSTDQPTDRTEQQQMRLHAEFSPNLLASKAALSWLDWVGLRFSGQPSRLGRPTKKGDQRQLLLQNRFSAPPKTPPLRSSSSSSAHLFLSTCNKVFTRFR